MKRWSFWQAVIAVFVSFSPALGHAAEVTRRPNIVFLLANQWRAKPWGVQVILMHGRRTSIAWRRKA